MIKRIMVIAIALSLIFSSTQVNAAEYKQKGIEELDCKETNEISVTSEIKSVPEVYSGVYKGLTWSIDSNGLLLISGTATERFDTKFCWTTYLADETSVPYTKIKVSVTRDKIYSTEGWFTNTTATNIDLSDFDTTNVINMSSMFNNCFSLKEINLSNFNTSNVTNMKMMFDSCQNLKNLNISNFDTSNVIDMSHMFGSCFSLTSLDISNFKTSNVTDMSCMFYSCRSVTKLDVSNFKTSNVTNMFFMFFGCGVTELDVSNFDTSKVTNMSGMFACGVTELDVSNFDTSKVTNMSGMFECGVTELDVSNFNTSKVTDMSCMFVCERLKSLDISNFDTSNVTDMSQMFWNISLTSLDISNFDMSKVNVAVAMFDECQFTKLKTPRNCSIEVSLPKTMYDINGTAYSYLPLNQTAGFWIATDKDSCPKESTILNKESYQFKITDKDGNAINGATVTLGDTSKKIGADGKTEFPASISVPNTLKVEKIGYISLSEPSYQPETEKLNTVQIYKEGENLHTIKKAIYSYGCVNLCKNAKKISTSALNVLGFNIICSTIGDQDTIAKYQLRQNSTLIKESNNGVFNGLKTNQFSLGGNVYIRVIGTDGMIVDTPIKLELVADG
ncbi:MAG: BspA family leucine-rich repeat surface protein, partial [Lachnospiraceae bacterium]|nr:BspA family leucine-rich repeat surface protein [Lachnospiraceae bacterium]